MKLKITLFSIVLLSALFLSAFGSPAAPQNVKLQETVQPPPVTVDAETTPGAIPVTGGSAPASLWTLLLFGLLGLLGLAFLVGLFSPRAARGRAEPVPPQDSHHDQDG